MRSFAERIQWIQDYSDAEPLTQAEVARRGKMTPAGLSRLVRASKKHPEKTFGSAAALERLASGNNVDLAWLTSGKGTPRKGKLSPRDTVLNERKWSPQTRAAAMAEKRSMSAGQWRRLLEQVEALFGDGSPESRPVDHRAI